MKTSNEIFETKNVQNEKECVAGLKEEYILKINETLTSIEDV